VSSLNTVNRRLSSCAFILQLANRMTLAGKRDGTLLAKVHALVI